MTRETHASAKDIRTMVDAVHNACVELRECGDLILARQHDDIEFPFELMAACSYVSQLASGLAAHLLHEIADEEEQRHLKRKRV
jgi:hypothetical protein